MIKDTRTRPYYIVKPKKYSPEIMPFSVEYDRTVKIINLNEMEIYNAKDWVESNLYNNNDPFRNSAAICRKIENKQSWFRLADKLFESLNL